MCLPRNGQGPRGFELPKGQVSKTFFPAWSFSHRREFDWRYTRCNYNKLKVGDDASLPLTMETP